ncbi:MAG: hypothetical protein GF310_09335 [candidate division Zixibacteria bacterium]|nr:hypothetical protein [candidate division Zixibacteria bacterium]
MKKAAIDPGKLLNIPGSKSHTLNAIAVALKTNKELVIGNPYPKIDLDKYKSILGAQGFEAEHVDNGIRLKKAENAQECVSSEKLYDLDDPVALLAAIRFKMPVRFFVEDNEDYERKYLILRRLGIEFGEIEKINDRNILAIVDFKPVKVKFSFQESNFYMADYVGLICALCDLETEFLSKIDVVKPLAEFIYPLELELENLQKPAEETDELEKRLRKFQKQKQEERLHYRIKGITGDTEDNLSLPADKFITSLAAVMAAIDSDEETYLGPLKNFDGDKAFSKILAKLGITCEIYRHTVDDDDTQNYLKIAQDKLKGRKIDEALMREFTSGFGPLAVLASFADDKTILRGLPSSSSLWQSRISGVSDILSTAGLRVGEVEDGFVIEPPNERGDIVYQVFDDPYLQLVQLTAGILINEKPLTAEFFKPMTRYPHFQFILDKIRPRSKSLAS